MLPSELRSDVWIEQALVRSFRPVLAGVEQSCHSLEARKLKRRLVDLAAGRERPAQTQVIVVRAASVEAAGIAVDHLPAEVSLLVLCSGNTVPDWCDAEPVAEVLAARASVAARTRALKRACSYALRRSEYHHMTLMSARRARHLEELNLVGLALSTEHDLDRLLALIVTKARELTNADAGSLYLVERGGGKPDTLFFKVAQNDTLRLDFSAFRLPLSRGSIAGFTALSGQILNLPDVYTLPEDSEYKFNRSFDQQTNYRSKSMLVVPMINHQGSVIGVLQLINKKRCFETLLTSDEVVQREVCAFSDEDESLLSSLASQAAVAIENAQLYEAIRAQFESFVQASVWAIEQRDPPTAGHSNRVTALTVALAQAVHRAQSGPFAGIRFSDKQIREIYYAGMLHDFGKINVSERVFSKAKKLYPHELKAIEDRFQLIRRSLKAQTAECVVAALAHGDRAAALAQKEVLEAELAAELDRIDAYWEVVLASNEPTVLQAESRSELEEMRSRVYHDPELGQIPLLTEAEYANLSIPRGSLNEAERAEIQSHVQHSYNFLRQIPWTQDLSEVADIAWGHHEMLDGSGYPRGISGAELRIESRMMAICDIFDALTASDRPYKKALPLEEALRILKLEAEAGKLDADLVELFVRERIYTVVPVGQASEGESAA